MKRSLCLIFLTAFLLCGCTKPAAEPKWQPFDGNAESYVYYHQSERERDWEEDVLYLAQDFLEHYPIFQPGKSHMYYYAIQGLSTTYGYLYDQQLQTDFLERINTLIPKLAELTDAQIRYELQKIVASLGDVHSQVTVEIDYTFLFLTEMFYVGDRVEYYVTALPVLYRDLLHSKLISINGVTTDEIAERLRPYIPVENEHGLHAFITDLNGMLYDAGLLAEVGILESETGEAVLLLEDQEGVQHTVCLLPVTIEEFNSASMAWWYLDDAWPDSFQNWNQENFWYEILPEENTAFVRINRFEEEENETIKQMFESLMASLKEHKQVTKVIVDLRRNGGGNMFMEGYPRLLQALKLPQIQQVCVLIDHGSFSQSVVMAYEIRQEVDTAVLIGTPAAEGSFFIGIRGEHSTLPNSGLNYRVATAPLDLNREAPFDALMPDVVVYPTPEDYQNGIDLILETAKQQS